MVCWHVDLGVMYFDEVRLAVCLGLVRLRWNDDAVDTDDLGDGVGRQWDNGRSSAVGDGSSHDDVRHCERRGQEEALGNSSENHLVSVSLSIAFAGHKSKCDGRIGGDDGRFKDEVYLKS